MNILKVDNLNSENVFGKIEIFQRVRNISILKNLFTFFSLVLLSGGIDTLLVVKSSYDIESGSPLYIRLMLVIIMISLIYLVSAHKKTIELLSKDIFPILLILLILLSFFWSYSPALTFRRSVAILGNTFFVIFIVVNYNIVDFIKILAYSLITVLALTVVISIQYPEIGTHSEVQFYGAWRGGFNHKNRTGQYLTLGLLSFLYYSKSLSSLYLKKDKIYILSFFIIIIFAYAIIKTQSTTSLIACIFIGIFIIILYFIKKFDAYNTSNLVAFNGTLCSIVSIAIIIFISNSSTIVGYFGKDLSFSGRTYIWEKALVLGKQKMFFGGGFKAFWPEFGKREYFGFPLDHGHNGFLDVYLDIGIVGLLITIIMFFKLFRRSLKIYNKKIILTSFPLMISLYIISFSITGVRFVDQNSLFYVVFLTSYYFVLQINYNESVMSG